MRVIAGTARGRRLAAPAGDRIRPTGDRVRESLFNMLEVLVGFEGARVADLCCGTGAMGIEALSRGAASVVFVDSDARSLRTTTANLEATGFGHLGPSSQPAVRLESSDVVGWARRLGADAADVALVDPPYEWAQWQELMAALDGKVEVVAAEADHEIDAVPAWDVHRSRRYGGTVVTVLCADPPVAPA